MQSISIDGEWLALLCVGPVGDVGASLMPVHCPCKEAIWHGHLDMHIRIPACTLLSEASGCLNLLSS